MEENRTLTGVERKYVEKHKGILERRLSYLNERYLLRQNSFDGAEIQSLKHCIWLLHLELDGGIVLTDGTQASRTTDSGNTGVGSDKPKTTVVLRKAPKPGEHS